MRLSTLHSPAMAFRPRRRSPEKEIDDRNFLFFCINTLCKRRIFTEKLTTVTAPWARRTLRLAQRLSAIALANGGAAGVRLSERLGIKVSRNTNTVAKKRV